MALTPQDVSRIAHLARLQLSTAEAAQMLVQLNGFFRIVEQMDAVDTSGVEPLYTPLSAVQVSACACAMTPSLRWWIAPPTSAVRPWWKKACSWCPR